MHIIYRYLYIYTCIYVCVYVYVHIETSIHKCKCLYVLVIEKVPVDGSQECITGGFVGCLFMKKSVRNLISS